jgi:hypothetical protein
MKIASKILMLVLLVLSFSLPLADNVYAMAQISLQNNTKLWLNLYIDGNFGCGPVMPSGFCTSSVKEGSHLLEAKKGEEVMSYEKGVNIGDGTSPTWTVTIEDPDQVLIKRLNGARYIGHLDKGVYKEEDELVIHGNTLVLRNRITWARGDIAKSMDSGTEGFKQRQIGEWLDDRQLQIVGREASQKVTLYDGQSAILNYTISEDGSSIFYRDGWGNSITFYRQ